MKFLGLEFSFGAQDLQISQRSELHFPAIHLQAKSNVGQVNTFHEFVLVNIQSMLWVKIDQFITSVSAIK